MKNQKSGHHNINENNKPLLDAESCLRNGRAQEDICQAKKAESQQALEDRIKISDRWMIRLTAALVFVSMISATIYYFQLRAMKTQADIMQGQLIVAKDSIEIAKKTLEDARKSGEEQSAKAERLTKANENISNAALQSADAMTETVAQSKRSLDATIENYRLDQRAWISKKTIVINEFKDEDKNVFLKEGQRFKFEVIISNTGKTLARVLTTKVYLSVVESGIKPDLAQSAIISTEPTPFVMFPGDNRSSGGVLAGTYSKEQIEAIKVRRYTLYVYGMITYKDVFGKSHWTQYCDYLSPDLTTLTACPFYNETDDTQKAK